MNTCDFGHDEICFNGVKCPACEIKSELTADVIALQEEIQDMKLREKIEEPA